MNPYQNLPNRAFWKPAVAQISPFEINTLWEPKFKIDNMTAVSTYGSCFAQAIGHALQNRGFNWLKTELQPYGLSEENIRKFNYSVFSSRTGNIYTTALFRQWLSWAAGTGNAPDEVWEVDGRFYDPFRPVVEPTGFQSVQETLMSRNVTIAAFRKSIEDASLLVFTMGLTEAWVNGEHGCEYPMCPGTAAGEFDASKHHFVNHDFASVSKNLSKAVELCREINPTLRIMLTVSPVPMTATNSGDHVVVATMRTKSLLRTVAGEFNAIYDFIDYFPGYEIANSPAFRGILFGPNHRNMSAFGVKFVMDQFALGLIDPQNQSLDRGPGNPDFLCEEELLEAFGDRR